MNRALSRAPSALALRIIDLGLIPIVRFERWDQAQRIVEALFAANVGIVEFPMTSPQALKAIEKISDAYGDAMVVGAGTVLDVKTVRACALAGARFIVSPCVDYSVIRACRARAIVVCPGALTPTEAQSAWEAGADFVKIFPCDSMGGVAYIKSLKTPLPDVAMIPVGGVTAENAGDFIRAGCVAVGVGNGLIDKKALAASRYKSITLSASKYLKAIREARRARTGRSAGFHR